MKLDQKQFLNALNRVVPFSKQRSTMPILNMLRLEAKGGHLEIQATDLDIHATASCDCVGDLPAVCVSSQMVYGLAKSSLPEIWLKIEKERLRFESNGSASLPFLADKDFPAFPKTEAAALGIPLSDLADGVESVAWAAAADKDNIYPLNEALWVKCEAKSITCACSDTKKIARFHRPVIACDTEFMFPAVYAPALSSILRAEGSVLALSDNHLIATSPSMSMAVRLYAGLKYYAIDRVLSQEQVPCGDIPLRPLIEAVNCSIMVGQDTSHFAYVTLVPGKGRTRLICQDANGISSYRTWLPFTMPNRIDFDATKMKEALSHFDTPTVTASLGANGIIFKAHDLTFVLSLCVSTKPWEDDELAEELKEAVPA